MYVVKGYIYIFPYKKKIIADYSPHLGYTFIHEGQWPFGETPKSHQIWSTMNTNMTRKSIDKKRPLEEMRQPSMSSADQPASQSDNNPAFMLLLFPHSFTLACSLYTK